MTANLTFGEAITALKNGHRVARAGWNGKGMWLRLVPEQRGVPEPETSPDAGMDRGHRAYIQMKDAQDMLVPWLASQTDMLAEDWGVVS